MADQSQDLWSNIYPDSATQRLLRERSGISNSIRGVNTVLAQASEAKDTLLGQRSSIGGASVNLSSLTRRIPGVGKLMDALSKKKSRENTIIGVFIGILVCFSMWWLFLR